MCNANKKKQLKMTKRETDSFKASKISLQKLQYQWTEQSLPREVCYISTQQSIFGGSLK